MTELGNRKGCPYGLTPPPAAHLTPGPSPERSSG